MQRHSSFDPKAVWRLKVARAEGEAGSEAEDDEDEEDQKETDTDEDMEASDEEDGSGRSSDELYSSELQQVCPVCHSIQSCRNMKDLAEHVWQQHRLAKRLRDQHAAFDFTMSELRKTKSRLARVETVKLMGEKRKAAKKKAPANNKRKRSKACHRSKEHRKRPNSK